MFFCLALAFFCSPSTHWCHHRLVEYFCHALGWHRNIHRSKIFHYPVQVVVGQQKPLVRRKYLSSDCRLLYVSVILLVEGGIIDNHQLTIGCHIRPFCLQEKNSRLPHMHAHVRSSLHWDLGTTTCSHDDMQKAMERSHVDGKEDITQVQDSNDMYINCIIRIKLVNFALDFPASGFCCNCCILVE